MKSLALAAVLFGAVCPASAAIRPGDIEQLAASAEVVGGIEKTIPADYWNRAHCIAVVPNLKKAAFIVGGEYGRGVLSCRAGERWSAPLFLQLAKGSFGFQAGAQQIDLVLLVMNESGAQKLLQNKVTLGVDAAVAAGPLGRQAAAATDAQLKAEILSYSRAEGLFAGLDVSGGILRPDDEANKASYGSNATPRRILANSDISAPVEAASFIQALAMGSAAINAASRGDAAPAAGNRAAPVPAASRAVNDTEVRARLASLQQAIDRLLSESAAAEQGGAVAVGTSGEGKSGRVLIDRDKLVQIRQQLDELLRMMNR